MERGSPARGTEAPREASVVLPQLLSLRNHNAQNPSLSDMGMFRKQSLSGPSRSSPLLTCAMPRTYDSGRDQPSLVDRNSPASLSGDVLNMRIDAGARIV